MPPQGASFGQPLPSLPQLGEVVIAEFGPLPDTAVEAYQRGRHFGVVPQFEI